MIVSSTVGSGVVCGLFGHRRCLVVNGRRLSHILVSRASVTFPHGDHPRPLEAAATGVGPEVGGALGRCRRAAARDPLGPPRRRRHADLVGIRHLVAGGGDGLARHRPSGLLRRAARMRASDRVRIAPGERSRGLGDRPDCGAAGGVFPPLPLRPPPLHPGPGAGSGAGGAQAGDARRLSPLRFRLELLARPGARTVSPRGRPCRREFRAGGRGGRRSRGKHVGI